eukprot:Nk52_evm17s276 gene=Nk52_evmTU17s276
MNEALQNEERGICSRGSCAKGHERIWYAGSVYDPNGPDQCVHCLLDELIGIGTLPYRTRSIVCMIEAFMSLDDMNIETVCSYQPFYMLLKRLDNKAFLVLKKMVKKGSSEQTQLSEIHRQFLDQCENDTFFGVCGLCLGLSSHSPWKELCFGIEENFQRIASRYVAEVSKDATNKGDIICFTLFAIESVQPEASNITSLKNSVVNLGFACIEQIFSESDFEFLVPAFGNFEWVL